MNFLLGCMGVPPLSVKGPCALGCDVRYGSYDVSIAHIEIPKPGLYVPKLDFYGKVDDERATMFLQQQYGVRASVIDSRPDATIASRFREESKSRGIKCYRAQYATSPTNRKIIVDESEGLITLDRTQTLDDVFAAISEGMGLALPQNFAEICGGQFVNELKASSREPVVWHGIPTFMWKESGDDHAFHSLNYMMLAILLGNLLVGDANPQQISKGTVVSQFDEEDDEEDEWSFGKKKSEKPTMHSA